jgi:hypothetical protein
LSAYPDVKFLLHGNPYRERKIVLSDDLLDQDSFTPVTVVNNTDIVETFLSHVTSRSQAATRDATHLIILFCHGGNEARFILDHSDTVGGVTLSQIGEAIEPGCQVTLISSSSFSGGWIARELHPSPTGSAWNTIPTAAGPESQSKL